MRRLLTVMGIAALALVGALSLPFVAAQNQTAQGLVEGMLQDILSSEGRRVVVEDVAISIDGDVTASRIEIHDGAGVWLVMEKFSLDWQPLSLLSSSLKIDSLSVDRIGIQRLPESSDAKAETPAELTGLQDADIAKVTISKLEISEHLADDEFTFKIEGSGSIKQTPPEVKFELQADRTNGGDSQLLAKLLLDPLSRNLDVDLRLQESSSGLVVNLLNIDDEPAVDLSVTAKGTIENWAGQFALKLNDRDVIGGTSEIRTVADGRRLTINADGEVGPFLSPQIAAFFDDSTQLTGSVLFQPGKSQASVERIRLGNELVQLRASGPVDWSGTTTNLAVELRSHDERSLVLSRTEGSLGDISASDLDADLLITGSLQAPKWTLSGSAQDLTSDAAQLTNLSVKLQGTGFDPGLVDFTAGGEISAEIAAGKSNLLPKALTGQAQIRFSAKTDEERRLSLSDTTLTIGSAKMALDGHALPHNGTFDVGFNASTSSPSTGRLLFDRLLQGDVRLAGRIAKNETGRLALSNWRVNGEKLSAALQGGVDEASLDLTLKADLLDLSGLHADATGSANLTATLKGARAAPELEFLAIGKGVTLMGTPFTEPRLEAKVKLSADRPAGDLTFTGKLQDLPVRAHAVLETAPDGTRALRDLSVASGSARLDGELSLPSAGPPTGRLKLAAPNLRDVAPLLLMQLAGSLSADINLERTGDIGRLRAKFSGADITSEGFAVKTVAGDVLIDDLLGRPKAQGDINLREVHAGAMAFSSIAATARSKGANGYQVELDATGNDLSLDALADVELNAQETVVSLAKLSGAAQGIAFSAAKPFQVNLSRSGTIVVEGGAIAIGNGQVTVEGTAAPDLDVRIGVDAVPLSAFERLSSVPGLSGALSGNIILKGDVARPDGTLDLTGTDIAAADLQALGFAAVSFRATGKMARGKLTLDSSVNAGTELSASVDGGLNLNKPVSIDIRARGRTSAAPFAGRLSGQGARLSGSISFDIAARGPMSEPAVDGTMTLEGATFGDVDGLFIVRDASGRLVFEGNQIRIDNIQGVTGKSGRARISGTVGLDAPQSADIRVRVTDGSYADGTLVNTGFDADLHLSGPLADAPLLEGEITLKKTKITLSEIPPTSLKPLEVRHKKAPAKIVSQIRSLQTRSSSSDSPIRLNLRIVAKDPISVRGRGLNVLLGGTLGITGTAAAPEPNGSFRLRRGTLKLLARRLEFESGRLDFQSDLDPRINLVAISRGQDATIRLVISGRASAPEISVTSSPELPQEEALARLVFDRDLVQLSPLQIAQLASSIAVLSGGGGGGLLGDLQSALGVDWLEITQTPKGETAVGIGKQVNDRLSVGVEQTTKTNTSRVIIDLGVTKNLKLRGAAGTDGASRAGVFFERDY